jgi:hypothetical protein
VLFFLFWVIFVKIAPSRGVGDRTCMTFAAGARTRERRRRFDAMVCFPYFSCNGLDRVAASQCQRQARHLLSCAALQHVTCQPIRHHNPMHSVQCIRGYVACFRRPWVLYRVDSGSAGSTPSVSDMPSARMGRVLITPTAS